jgi:hypothetical protein
MAGTITVRPGESLTVVGIPADAPLPPYIPGPVDPGYSPPWAQIPPGGSVPPGPVDPGYSPPWATVRPPVDPGYSPPWAQVPGVPIEPPTEPPPVQLPDDSGHWLWAWSPQMGRWVWVKVPGEGDMAPKTTP